MSTLSQWLQLMLAEISRKQEDQQNARAEADLRATEHTQAQQPNTPPVRARR